ncbi:hypothetical protein QCA50_017397 [Cerrena zonata]|uniref:Uncharacterized protein n=1 Tax=Cerrena zonata TaxID=2478898 RepID=A0AAW0FFG9_9APHY
MSVTESQQKSALDGDSDYGTSAANRRIDRDVNDVISISRSKREVVGNDEGAAKGVSKEESKTDKSFNLYQFYSQSQGLDIELPPIHTASGIRRNSRDKIRQTEGSKPRKVTESKVAKIKPSAPISSKKRYILERIAMQQDCVDEKEDQIEEGQQKAYNSLTTQPPLPSSHDELPSKFSDSIIANDFLVPGVPLQEEYDITLPELSSNQEDSSSSLHHALN